MPDPTITSGETLIPFNGNTGNSATPITDGTGTVQQATTVFTFPEDGWPLTVLLAEGRFPPDPSELGYFAGYHDFSTPQDFSGGFIGAHLRTNLATGSVAEGGAGVVFFDTSGNWAWYWVDGWDREPPSIGESFSAHLIDPAAPPHASQGVVDYSVIDRVEFIYNKVDPDSLPKTFWTRLATYAPYVIGGGTLANPAALQTLLDFTDTEQSSLYLRQGLDQILVFTSIRIAADYFNDGGFSLQFQPSASPERLNLQANVIDGSFTFTIAPPANGYCRLSSTIITSERSFPFEVNPGAGAVVEFDLFSLRNANPVTLQGSGTTLSGFGASNCGAIQVGANTITSGGVSQAKASEVAAVIATPAATLRSLTISDNPGVGLQFTAPPGDYSNLDIAFSGNATDIQIVATGAGDFDLSNCRSTGTLSLDNASPHDIVVTIPLNQAFAVTSTGGGAITIVNTLLVDITAPNLADGTRVQLYNVTDDVELANSIVSGGEGFTYSLNFAAEKDIRMKAALVAGVTAQTFIQATGVLNAGGLAFTVEQQDNLFYNEIALDGSTMTEFAPDYENVRLDINAPSGQTTFQRMYAWYQHMLFTEEGIRQMSDFVQPQGDVFNFLVEGAPLQLHNLSANALTILDGIIDRADGGSVIFQDPATGSVYIKPQRVYSLGVSQMAADLRQIRELEGLGAVVTAKTPVPGGVAGYRRTGTGIDQVITRTEDGITTVQNAP